MMVSYHVLLQHSCGVTDEVKDKIIHDSLRRVRSDTQALSQNKYCLSRAA
jgi:hypothetical protein